MKRRQALRRTGWILKSSLFSPAIMQALSACRESGPPETEQLVLNQEKHQLIRAISDVIIPSTESPSASEVGVNRFLDLLLRDVFEEEVVDEFLMGLVQFATDCQQKSGKSFIDMNTNERNHYLRELDEEVMAKAYQDTVPFYYAFKNLVTRIYFSTEEGIRQNLNYQPVPGPYQGVVPYDPSHTITVGNHL